MPNVSIKPFRDFDPHDVINLYAYTGTSLAAGSFVAIANGWDSKQNVNIHGSAGAAYNNTVSPRWSIEARVGCATSGASVPPLGMALYGVAETDENGEKLLYRPQKQTEMQVVLSGQALPIVTRGIFLYSGIQGSPSAGSSLYVDMGGGGGLNVVGLAADKVGVALGAKDTDGYALIKINL
jgi:hypothetical protein